MVGFTIFVMGIPLLITFIITHHERNYLVKRLQNYTNEITQIRDDLNVTNRQLKNTSKKLKSTLKIIDELVSFSSHYQKIGEFGNFYRLNELMNYNDGQAACANVKGKKHIMIE